MLSTFTNVYCPKRYGISEKIYIPSFNKIRIVEIIFSIFFLVLENVCRTIFYKCIIIKEVIKII